MELSTDGILDSSLGGIVEISLEAIVEFPPNGITLTIYIKNPGIIHENNLGMIH